MNYACKTRDLLNLEMMYEKEYSAKLSQTQLFLKKYHNLSTDFIGFSILNRGKVDN